jgi:hypothetical protein
VKEQGMDQTQQALNPAVDLAGILLSEWFFFAASFPWKNYGYFEDTFYSTNIFWGLAIKMGGHPMNLWIIWLLIFFFRFELRALHLGGRCSPLEPHLQPFLLWLVWR